VPTTRRARPIQSQRDPGSRMATGV
jgi:hypothetical protein